VCLPAADLDYPRPVRRTAAIPLLALLVACASPAPTGEGGGGGAPAPTGPTTAAVKRYEYRFDLATAHAKSELALDVAAPGGDCFTASDRLAAASSATWNGAAAASSGLVDGQLQICGKEGVRGGEALTVGAEGDVPQKTFLSLDVGFHRDVDQDGGQFSYLLSWVGGCDHFGPCDPDPSRLVDFHFEIAHAPGTVALCPGTLTDDGAVTTCDVAGAPTYSAFGFAADPLWQRAPFTTAGGVDLVFYETPSGKLASSLDKADVETFMGWITGLLGPFPYGNELRFAGGPTAWLGFEHPANIILNEALGGVQGAYTDPTMHVFMHETVHQWAGDRTTIASVPDFVWKEATAEYLSYVFEDEHRPPAEAAASLHYWKAISLQSSSYPRPTDDPPPAVQDFYGDVYGPGPMVLYVQLESLLGRQAVLGGIQAFLAEPGARTVADLRDALSKSSGQDLTAYFDAWVFGKGKPELPTLKIETAQAGDQVTVTVTQVNASGKLYGCKAEVAIQGATSTATATIDFGVAPTAASKSTVVTLAEPVTGLSLDPQNRLLARGAGATMVKPAEKRKVWIL
jgi:aminopeptidase N